MESKSSLPQVGKSGGKPRPRKGEGGFREDGVGDAQRRRDHDGGEDARQDVPQDEAARGGAERARGDHELAPSERQRVAAHDAGGLHPGGEADDGGDEDEDARLRPEGRRAARPRNSAMVTSRRGSSGRARKRSVSRMSGPSSRLKQPAARPTAVPTVRERAMAAAATASDTRPPASIRARVSRPRRSAPSGWARLGPWFLAAMSMSCGSAGQTQGPSAAAEGGEEQEARSRHRPPMGAEARPRPAPRPSHGGWRGRAPRRGGRPPG